MYLKVQKLNFMHCPKVFSLTPHSKATIKNAYCCWLLENMKISNHLFLCVSQLSAREFSMTFSKSVSLLFGKIEIKIIMFLITYGESQ